MVTVTKVAISNKIVPSSEYHYNTQAYQLQRGNLQGVGPGFFQKWTEPGELGKPPPQWSPGAKPR